jgi:hypothetical protein
MADQSRLTWALVLSVLLHGLLLSLLPLLRRAQLEIPAPAFVDVDLLQMPKRAPAPPPPAAAPAPAVPAPAIPVPKQQIVSPPDEGEEKEPANARLLSDRNNTVKEEMVHRGEPLPGSPEAKTHTQPQTTKAKAEHEALPEHRAEPKHPTQMAALPKLDELLPSTGDLVREGIIKPEELAPQPPQQEASTQRTDLLRHGDPWRSGVRGGSMDFLPAVREGDVTMLNTKADQFAPFVRRVAVRVFENFIILLRRSVDGAGHQSVQESATIEAIMDKEGRLVAINTKDRSLSAALATDRNLQAACREGFFDRNPPAGAEASDGQIHFVFETQVQLAIDPRGRAAGWQAILGAGLL